MLPLLQMGVLDADGNVLANPRRGFNFDWRVGGWVAGNCPLLLLL